MNIPTNLDPVLTTVDKARGLPNAHYIDPHVFDEEREAVLFSNWAGVGFGKDIPEPGDAKPVDFLCLLYTSPSPRDQRGSRMPSSA